jgi:hypothetical protein
MFNRIRFNRIRVSVLALPLAVALLAAASVPQLRAGEQDKETIVTFSGPVEIGNRVLPAGTYVFKTLGDERNFVTVTSGDERHVYGIFLTQSIEAATVPTKPEVELSERSGDSPQAVHAWFYPGDNIGWEFITPKANKTETSKTE